MKERKKARRVREPESPTITVRVRTSPPKPHARWIPPGEGLVTCSGL